MIKDMGLPTYRQRDPYGIQKRRGRSEASIKVAEDKINFTMVARLDWAPGMYSKGGEFKNLDWDKRQITTLLADGDSLGTLMKCKNEFKQEACNMAGRYLTVVAPLWGQAQRHETREK